jgi:tRNA uridine 5-carboxymethylaminomethyl modification enzyme
VDLALVAFDEIGGLSNEIREKLNHVRPESLGAAARIQGMTPAALASIAAFVRKRESA